jgi:hypothetical protein
MKRREYEINITVNRKRIDRVIIDPHYEEKHAASISDEIILSLVKDLDGKEFESTDEDPPFSYFTTDKMKLNGKYYKLIWLLENEQIYIGVVNTYRR